MAEKKDDKRSPGDDPTSIGNVLITLGALTRDQLAEALSKQETGEAVKLGGVVCELGFCTIAEVEKAVELQDQMRNGTPAEASVATLEATTGEMKKNAEKLAGLIDRARAKARENGEKTGLFLFRPAG